jgi:hypothetical protein
MLPLYDSMRDQQSWKREIGLKGLRRWERLTDAGRLGHAVLGAWRPAGEIIPTVDVNHDLAVLDAREDDLMQSPGSIESCASEQGSYPACLVQTNVGAVPK